MKRLELFRNRLYQKAKEEPKRKFYSLHDKLCRLDILEEAWEKVSANHGTAGIDKQTVDDIRAYGADKFLIELQRELIDETYNISNVRRVFIQKENGKMRPLGIPTVKDRVVQQAVKSIIEPIFEADFQDFSYGYRPHRSAKHASEEIRKYLNFGLTNVIDIDIMGFFDHIDHEKMIFFVMRRIADPYILKLIREWLKAGVVHDSGVTYPDMGTPQGGVISPLLANIYLNELDTLWVKKRMNDRQGQNAQIIRYADDMVILTDRDPENAMTMLKRIISFLDLELNMEKSKITTAAEGFDFLGIHFMRKWSSTRNKTVTYNYPSVKAMDRFRKGVKQVLQKRTAHQIPMVYVIRRLNDLIRGWYNYYNHTNASQIFKRLNRYIQWKVAKRYCQIHKIRRVSSRGDMFPTIQKLGIYSLESGIRYGSNSLLPEVKHAG